MLAHSHAWISCVMFACHITLQVLSQGSNRLKLTVLSEDRLQMKWKETEGNTNGYKVRVKPMAGDSEQEVMLKTKTAKVTVGGLSPTKEYTLQIYILNGSQEALFVKRKFVIEELKNLSQARSNRRHPTSAPEKTEMSPESTTPPYILETFDTSPAVSEVSTLINIGRDELDKKKQKPAVSKGFSERMLSPAPTLIPATLTTMIPTLPSQIEYYLALEKTTRESLRRGLTQSASDPFTEWNLITYSPGIEVRGSRSFALQGRATHSQGVVQDDEPILGAKVQQFGKFLSLE
ncbi:collagen alpha-1(XX) chain-like [Sceloporus undulatus]|uniref:collagen alpha-1(XX) chain-like n=1 Tax=Sceloporus undulatus TaxID=8520 RepID=UPI001C4B597D|nr:collagen alpha-1(XX) chain-like [Sceloporus undulatus]